MAMSTITVIPGARALRRGWIVTYTGAETLPENGAADIWQDLNQEDKKEVEEITREPSACHEWKEHRSKRLTAYFFETVRKRKATTSCANEYAIENNISIFQWCRLVIEDGHPFLGASPDGLIGDDAVLEVNCSTTANLVTPLETLGDKILNSLTCEMVYRNQEQMIPTKRENPKEIPPANGNVLHVSCVPKSGVTPQGIEHGALRWDTSNMTTTPSSSYLAIREDGDDLGAGVLWPNVPSVIRASNANAQPDARIFPSHGRAASPSPSKPTTVVLRYTLESPGSARVALRPEKGHSELASSSNAFVHVAAGALNVSLLRVREGERERERYVAAVVSSDPCLNRHSVPSVHLVCSCACADTMLHTIAPSVDTLSREHAFAQRVESTALRSLTFLLCGIETTTLPFLSDSADAERRETRYILVCISAFTANSESGNVTSHPGYAKPGEQWIDLCAVYLAGQWIECRWPLVARTLSQFTRRIPTPLTTLDVRHVWLDDRSSVDGGKWQELVAATTLSPHLMSMCSSIHHRCAYGQICVQHDLVTVHPQYTYSLTTLDISVLFPPTRVCRGEICVQYVWLDSLKWKDLYAEYLAGYRPSVDGDKLSSPGEYCSFKTLGISVLYYYHMCEVERCVCSTCSWTEDLLSMARAVERFVCCVAGWMLDRVSMTTVGEELVTAHPENTYSLTTLGISEFFSLSQGCSDHPENTYSLTTLVSVFPPSQVCSGETCVQYVWLDSGPIAGGDKWLGRSAGNLYQLNWRIPTLLPHLTSVCFGSSITGVQWRDLCAACVAGQWTDCRWRLVASTLSLLTRRIPTLSPYLTSVNFSLRHRGAVERFVCSMCVWTVDRLRMASSGKEFVTAHTENTYSLTTLDICVLFPPSQWTDSRWRLEARTLSQLTQGKPTLSTTNDVSMLFPPSHVCSGKICVQHVWLDSALILDDGHYWLGPSHPENAYSLTTLDISVFSPSQGYSGEICVQHVWLDSGLIVDGDLWQWRDLCAAHVAGQWTECRWRLVARTLSQLTRRIPTLSPHLTSVCSSLRHSASPGDTYYHTTLDVRVLTSHHRLAVERFVCSMYGWMPDRVPMAATHLDNTYSLTTLEINVLYLLSQVCSGEICVQYVWLNVGNECRWRIVARNLSQLIQRIPTLSPIFTAVFCPLHRIRVQWRDLSGPCAAGQCNECQWQLVARTFAQLNRRIPTLTTLNVIVLFSPSQGCSGEICVQHVWPESGPNVDGHYMWVWFPDRVTKATRGWELVTAHPENAYSLTTLAFSVLSSLSQACSGRVFLQHVWLGNGPTHLENAYPLTAFDVSVFSFLSLVCSGEISVQHVWLDSGPSVDAHPENAYSLTTLDISGLSTPSQVCSGDICVQRVCLDTGTCVDGDMLLVFF
ncbi:hypothetical protein PR048_002021 [Dryococelus australis]|uniref:Uncharacterized protein n=1 Tax=Dryococelus australis TaxID=614101 RepID=A0ABQ9IK32_9NEOP|nr:hypothetical protein PR048_002021 [Dryococelus australis]